MGCEDEWLLISMGISSFILFVILYPTDYDEGDGE
jgi:hypothetical protein